MRLEGTRLTEGAAAGRLLVLTAPLSFYGGVDPETGVIVQADHPRRGERVTGRILALPRSSGSTVGSWTLLRMARLGTAPAAIVSATADAVLVTGTIAGGLVHLDGLTVDAELDGMEAVIPGDGAWLEVGTGAGPESDGGLGVLSPGLPHPLLRNRAGAPPPGTTPRPSDGLAHEIVHTVTAADANTFTGTDTGLAPGFPKACGSVTGSESDRLRSPLIVKLGGSLITVKRSPVPRVDFERLRALARLLADTLHGPAVILHGAGSFGHGPVARAGVLGRPLDDDARRDWGRIQALQYQLSAIVCEALADAGLPVYPFQASALGHLAGGRFVCTGAEPLRRALAAGFFPVLYGTPCFTDEAGTLGIASGDDLAPALALALNFSRIVHLTDVAGVHTEDPRTNPAAPVIPWITVQTGGGDDPATSWPEDSENPAVPITTTDVTGEISGKVKKLLDVAAAGVTSWIVDGRDPTAVASALAGLPAGTVVCATKAPNP